MYTCKYEPSVVQKVELCGGVVSFFASSSHGDRSDCSIEVDIVQVWPGKHKVLKVLDLPYGPVANAQIWGNSFYS